MPTDQAVEAHWAALGAMDRAALRVAWTGAFGAAPPHHLSMAFLRKALIWHEQCRRVGGGSPDLKRVLKAAAAGKSGAGGGATGPRPGSQLVREWNGRRYLVEVTDQGYVLDGQRFKSLSAIARHITGTAWSGPRFFGLTPGRGSA